MFPFGGLRQCAHGSEVSGALVNDVRCQHIVMLQYSTFSGMLTCVEVHGILDC